MTAKPKQSAQKKMVLNTILVVSYVQGASSRAIVKARVSFWTLIPSTFPSLTNEPRNQVRQGKVFLPKILLTVPLSQVNIL